MVKNLLINLIFSLAISNLLNSAIPSDSLPTDFPKPKILTKNAPSPGYIYYPVSGKGYGTYICVMDTAGNIVKYKKTPATISNLAIQSNGLICYNQAIKNYFKAYSEAKIYIADTSLKTIDSIISGNGFIPAPHSSMIMPNGHYLYTSFEPYNVDMSKVVKGGNPNSVVAGAILVEMDINKNVVFQWRAWDYIPIEDTYQPINDFLNVTTLYSNFNSVEIDFDGNYILSNRLLSEVTKINSKTGDIIWRLGGKNNQFTFLNEREGKEPYYFSMQHDVRFHSNGNISVFDNGDQHETKQSRGVEYLLDEKAKTATKIWDYQPAELIFTASAGSNQRLEDGNTLIGWGNNTSTLKRDITEIGAFGQNNFEVALPAGVYTFKALKFPDIIGKAFAKVTKNEILQGNTYKFDSGNNLTNVKMQFKDLEGFMYNSVTVSKYNYSPKYPKFAKTAPYVYPYRYEISTTQIDSFKAELRINLNNMEWIKYPERIVVMQRDSIANGEFTSLNTTYSSATNELVIQITREGEYILTKYDSLPAPDVPFLVYPLNKYKFNKNNTVKLNWSPKGYFNSSNLQISEDIGFAKIIVQENNLNKVTYFPTNLSEFKKYYWRVSINNESGTGKWSEIREFTINDPYIELTTPNGSEIYYKDSTMKFINWNHNLTNKVKIELYKNYKFEYLIADSLMSYTGSFGWIIPTFIQADSTYKIKISSIDDKTVYDESDVNFVIKEAVTDVDRITQESSFDLTCKYQSNQEITFVTNTPFSGYLSIKIYDLFGKEIDCVYSSLINDGKSEIIWNVDNLSTGTYFFKATFNSKIITGKVQIIK